MSTRSRYSITQYVRVGSKRMDPTLKCTLLLLMLLGLVVNATSSKADFEPCERLVRKWASSSLDLEVQENKHTLKDLLFFLHVPRTGGRTYFHCFLKKLYSSSLECPRSYDKLRFDPSKPNCKLLVTHDDYSMMSKLPKNNTSVVTILRNPVDRVFSTYEFSVEVAARFLMHPNLTSATQMARRVRSKTNAMSTLDIWPWKYLVPWMREDLFSRRDDRKLRGIHHVKKSDPYDMKEVVMPLLEYINDPIAHDIIHNGATFQIAGLTNNSFSVDSHEVRHCVQKHKVLGEYVLQVAKKRLDNMLYVGLTEDHRESATMFGNMVGAQVISQLVALNSSVGSAPKIKSEQSSSFSDSELNNNDQQNSTLEGFAPPQNTEVKKEKMTVEDLMEAYGVCISRLRKSQAQRRTNSLKRISPANFTKEARLHVPEVVLQQIKSLNNLDLELYKYAQDIFAKQHRQTAGETFVTERFKDIFKHRDGFKLSELFWWVMPFMLLFLFFLFVNARRRRSKEKI